MLKSPEDLGQADPLQKGMATHSSVLAWRIPWTGAWRATVPAITKTQIRLKRLPLSFLPDVETPFVCLLAVSMHSFRQCVFRSFDCFSVEVFVTLLLTHKHSL